MSEPLLEAENVSIKYETSSGMVSAVSDASFVIDEGEYFGLVGESGSGKSTIARAIMGGLDDNGQVTSGTIRYKGEEIQDYTNKQLNEKIRWKEISLIPQSSMNSLNPLQRVSEQAVELVKVHTDMNKEEALDRLGELFEIVGLPENRISDYPHQFSGGMQQRAIIAFSLLLEPSLIIADEPTTALDVIMQDQVFKYLDRIQEETDTSMLLITHDISLVFETCDSMAIMHAGQVAETGEITSLFDEPRHPYSIMLQQSFPDIRHPNRELEVIDGEPPTLHGDVDFCAFADRCPWAVEECTASAPSLENIDSTDSAHKAACFRKDEVLDLYRSEQESKSDQRAKTKGDTS